MKTVSGWLHAGSQQSSALDQAISVLAGAAGQTPKEASPPEAAEGENDAAMNEETAAEQNKDGEQADASPEENCDKQADVPLAPGETAPEEKAKENTSSGEDAAAPNVAGE